MKVNKEIMQYAYFINNSHEGIDKLCHNIEVNKRNVELADKIENGYYQFIWEIFVESQVCSKNEYLEAYGDGADFYDESSRVVHPEKVTTKKIVVNVDEGFDFIENKKFSIKDLDFIKLINFNEKEKIYSVKKPFDYVLCENNFCKKFIFDLNDVDFILINIED